MERGLRGGVYRRPGERREREARGHIDDGGALLAAEVRKQQHRQVNRSVEVDRELLAKRLPVGRLPQRAVDLDPGVVDEHVERRELADGPFRERDAAVLAGEVGSRTRRPDPLLCLAQFLLAAPQA
jgi:hypothetical protein